MFRSTSCVSNFEQNAPTSCSEARSRSSSLQTVDLEDSGVRRTESKPMMPVWDKLEAEEGAPKPRFRIRNWEEPYNVMYALSLTTMICLAFASLQKFTSSLISNVPAENTSAPPAAAPAARPPLQRFNASAQLQYSGFREVSEGMSSGPDLTSAISDCLHFDKHLFEWASSFTEKTFGPYLYRTMKAAAPRQQGLIGQRGGHAESTMRTLNGMYGAFASDVGTIITV